MENSVNGEMFRSKSSGAEGLHQSFAVYPAHGYGDFGPFQQDLKTVLASFIQLPDLIQIYDIGPVALHKHGRWQSLHPALDGMVNGPPEPVSHMNAGIVPAGFHI